MLQGRSKVGTKICHGLFIQVSNLFSVWWPIAFFFLVAAAFCELLLLFSRFFIVREAHFFSFPISISGAIPASRERQRRYAPSSLLFVSPVASRTRWPILIVYTQVLPGRYRRYVGRHRLLGCMAHCSPSDLRIRAYS